VPSALAGLLKNRQQSPLREKRLVMNTHRNVAAADNGDMKEEEEEILGRQIQQTLAAVKEL